MKKLVPVFIIGAVVLMSVGILWRMQSNQNPAYVMFSMGLGRTMVPSDPTERAQFFDHIKSQKFILKVLQRKTKYAPLIPEAEKFWHPKYEYIDENNHQITNNNVPTNLDRSYQPLLLDLRQDLYSEVDYICSTRQVQSNKIDMIQRGLSGLDALRNEAPHLDVVEPVNNALKNAQAEKVKLALKEAIKAAQRDGSMEEAFFKIFAARD